MPRAAAFLIASFVVLWVSSARAMTLRDGDRFSFDTGATAVCVVYPSDQRDPKPCETFSNIDTPVPVLKDGRAIASGIVLLGNDKRAIFTFIEIKSTRSKEPTTLDAIAFAVGIKAEVRRQVPRSATVREPHSEVVKAGKYSIIRTSIDVDGIPEDHADAVDAHQVFLVAYAGGRMYVIGTHARASARVEADSFVDAIAQTLTMANPVAPKSSDSSAFRAGELVGQLAVYGAIAAVIIVVVMRSRRRSALAPAALPVFSAGISPTGISPPQAQQGPPGQPPHPPRGTKY